MDYHRISIEALVDWSGSVERGGGARDVRDEGRRLGLHRLARLVQPAMHLPAVDRPNVVAAAKDTLGCLAAWHARPQLGKLSLVLLVAAHLAPDLHRTQLRVVARKELVEGLGALHGAEVDEADGQLPQNGRPPRLEFS
jgi:hypothetical protein